MEKSARLPSGAFQQDGKGEVKSPALKNRGQGTQSRLRIYCPGHPFPSGGH